MFKREYKSEKQLKAIIITCFALVWLLSVLIAGISWGSNLEGYLDIYNWFSRSGAIIVVLAAITEIIFLKSIATANANITARRVWAIGDSGRQKFQREIEGKYIIKYQAGLETSNFLLAVLGTFIWAYGDVFYILVNS